MDFGPKKCSLNFFMAHQIQFIQPLSLQTFPISPDKSLYFIGFAVQLHLQNKLH